MGNLVMKMKLLLENWRKFVNENEEAQVIKTSDEIELLVLSIHIEVDDDGTDDGNLIGRIKEYPYYILKVVELNKIETTWTDGGKVDDYAARETVPEPVVLDHTLSVIDGSHRVEAAIENGEETIMAYVGSRE